MKRTGKFFDAATAVFVAITVHQLTGSFAPLIVLGAAALGWSLTSDLLDLRDARRSQGGGRP